MRGRVTGGAASAHESDEHVDEPAITARVSAAAVPVTEAAEVGKEDDGRHHGGR